MGLKTPAEYVASLRDNRVTYWDGERIDDVTTHPRFALPLEVASRDYRVYQDNALRELMVYETEDGGEAHRIYQVPRSEADLLRRVEMMKHLSVVGTVSTVFMALMSAKDELGQADPRYAANIEAVYRHARDNDLRSAELITDSKGDRKRRAHQQDDPDLFLRIVERRSDGIVVRGAKLHITAASVVHELVVMPTKGMSEEEADYAVAFSIPVDTPGVITINHSMAPAKMNPFDTPRSMERVMPEGFVIFDDVFVPWERVFLAGEWKLAGVLAQSLGTWQRAGSLVDAIERAELFVGLAQLVSEHQGKDRDVAVQNVIADLVSYHELMRMSLDYACRHYETAPSGIVHPNILAVNVAKYHYAANYHAALRCLHEISGGLVVTLPGEADLRHEVTGPLLRKYLHTKPNVDVETRMRVYNLIRDLTADALAGVEAVAAIQAGGGLVAQRIMMNRTFDMAGAKRKALEAAGAG